MFQNTTLMCQNGVMINTQTGTVSMAGTGEASFKNLIIPSSDDKINVVLQDEDGFFDVILVPSSSGYNVILAQAPLGTSLFTKLFYLQGYGSKYFEKFDDVYSATGVGIKVWKVNWDGIEKEVELENSSLDILETSFDVDEVLDNNS